jgi:hypothetical protein
MTDNIYETESHHTPESRDRDARFVGHEVGPDRLGGMSFDAAIPVLTALRKSLYSEGAKRNSEVIALNTVLHMMPHLLAERDALVDEAEGAAAIIAAERAEVMKLRGQLAALSLRHERALLQGAENKNKLEKVGQALHEIQAGDMSPYEAIDMIRAAPKGDSHD